MASEKRFYYIGTQDGNIVHRFYSKLFVEGEKTACGIHVQRGWPFWVGRKGNEERTVCQRCENAHGA